MILKKLKEAGDLRWIAGIFVAIVVLLLLNPGGYIGGGQDDWRYLHAVRCWREYGPCLPQNHWQTRWPLIAPTAALTWILGESRLTVSLAPLAASVLALLTLGAVGNRLLGRPVGWLGVLAFAAIPAFSFQFTDLTVESTELLFIFAGFLAILIWEREGAPIWGFVAGLAFSLAFQTRETSIVAAGFAGLYFLMRKTGPKMPFVLWGCAGFAVPLLVEFATFAISTGDPFWRRRLALHHVLVPSSELLGPVDPNHSPFFNIAYIANWRHMSGIHVHWSVDWLLNLVFSGTAGLPLALVPVLLLAGRRSFDKETKRTALMLWSGALAYGAVLALALALDPKPRVMLVPLAMSSLAFALLTLRAKQAGRAWLAYAGWAAVLALWLPLHIGHRRTDLVESKARAWISARPGAIEIDENTRRHLALVAEAEKLPGIDAGRKYWIYMSSHGCHELLGDKGFPVGSLSPIDSAAVNSIYLVKRDTRTALCLLRFDKPATGDAINSAIRQSRTDGPYITGYSGS